MSPPGSPKGDCPLAGRRAAPRVGPVCPPGSPKGSLPLSAKARSAKGGQ